jgi:hypothetical protein
MMRENICDAMEHALHFAATRDAVVFNAEQIEDLKRLVGRIDSWMEEDSTDEDEGSGGSKLFWDDVRDKARRLLQKHGWEGEVDLQLYKYVDPATGQTTVPNPESNGECDDARDW